MGESADQRPTDIATLQARLAARSPNVMPQLLSAMRRYRRTTACSI
jgi:hypothetical protein